MTVDRTVPRSVLILEWNAGGHRLVYVRYLVLSALRSGIRVLIGLPTTVRLSDAFEAHLADLQEHYELVDIPKAPKLRDIRRISASHRVDNIIVPDGDRLAISLGLCRLLKPSTAQLTLLVMRDPRWTIDEKGALPFKQRIKLHILTMVSKLRGINLVWLRPPQTGHPVYSDVAQDPVILEVSAETIRHDAAAWRRSTPMGTQNYWFGLVGAISGRKNLGLIAAALSDLSRQTQVPLGLAIVGPIDPTGVPLEESLEVLRESGIATYVEDRLLTNHEMNIAISGLDCVVMAYSSHSPNSTMGKAAALGTRLVVAGPPSVRSFALQVIGRQGVPLDRQSLRNSLGRALYEPTPERILGLTEDNFTPALLRLVDVN